MNDKMRPALIGGVILGLLSAIPFVNFVNLCCCAWAIVGGAIAANMYIKGSTRPVTPADGAQVGAIAGVVGAVIYLIIGLPLGYVAGQAMFSAIESLFGGIMPPEQAAEFSRQMATARAQQGSFIEYLAGAIIQGLIGAVLLTVFATIGGLLGVQFFEKRKGDAAPPPPPDFGGGPTGGGGIYGGPAGGGGYGSGQG